MTDYTNPCDECIGEICEECTITFECPRCGEPGVIRNNAENLCDSCVEVGR